MGKAEEKGGEVKAAERKIGRGPALALYEFVFDASDLHSPGRGFPRS